MRKSIIVAVFILLITPIFVFALNSVSTGWRVGEEKVKIDAHNICKNVQTTDNKDYFVPTKTLSEWNAFLTNTPEAVQLSECCKYKINQLISSQFIGCAIKPQDNTLQCWNSVSRSPIAPIMSGSFKEIVHNGSVSAVCGLRLNGVVSCWNSAPSNNPQIVAPTGTFKTLVAHGANFCGIRSNDTVACWGEYKGWGDTGSGPAAVSPSGNFKSIVNNFAYSCGLRMDNSVVCWGTDAPSPSTYSSINRVANARSLHIITIGSDRQLCVIDETNKATCSESSVTNQLSSYDLVDIKGTCAVTVNDRQVCSNATFFQPNHTGFRAAITELASMAVDEFMWGVCSMEFDGTLSCMNNGTPAAIKNELRCE